MARWGASDATVVDFSYGGLRLETTDPLDAGRVEAVALPAAGLVVHARSVWSTRMESGKAWSGIEIDDHDPEVLDAWCRFVDRKN